MNVAGGADDQNSPHCKILNRADTTLSIPKIGLDDTLDQLDQLPTVVKTARGLGTLEGQFSQIATLRRPRIQGFRDLAVHFAGQAGGSSRFFSFQPGLATRRDRQQSTTNFCSILLKHFAVGVSIIPPQKNVKIAKCRDGIVFLMAFPRDRLLPQHVTRLLPQSG